MSVNKFQMWDSTFEVSRGIPEWAWKRSGYWNAILNLAAVEFIKNVLCADLG